MYVCVRVCVLVSVTMCGERCVRVCACVCTCECEGVWLLRLYFHYSGSIVKEREMCVCGFLGYSLIILAVHAESPCSIFEHNTPSDLAHTCNIKEKGIGQLLLEHLLRHLSRRKKLKTIDYFTYKYSTLTSHYTNSHKNINHYQYSIPHYTG